MIEIKLLLASTCIYSQQIVTIIEILKIGPVKLIKRVKIAHSFLQSVSNQFYAISLSLPVWFYKCLSKNFSKHTSKNEEIDCFNLSLLTESFS